jgi:hypothetical protein
MRDQLVAGVGTGGGQVFLEGDRNEAGGSVFVQVGQGVLACRDWGV